MFFHFCYCGLDDRFSRCEKGPRGPWHNPTYYWGVDLINSRLMLQYVTPQFIMSTETFSSYLFAFLFWIMTDAAITQMKGVSASNCTQVCEVESCQPPLVCATRAVRRPVSSHCYPWDAICALARTLNVFQPLYKLLTENCMRLCTNIIPAELYLVSKLKFLTTGQGQKCV